MEGGQITASGTPSEILASKGNGFVAHFFCGCVHHREGAAADPGDGTGVALS